MTEIEKALAGYAAAAAEFHCQSSDDDRKVMGARAALLSAITSALSSARSEGEARGYERAAAFADDSARDFAKIEGTFTLTATARSKAKAKRIAYQGVADRIRALAAPAPTTAPDPSPNLGTPQRVVVEVTRLTDDDGTISFDAPGLTTVRVCRHCGVLMTGGPRSHAAPVGAPAARPHRNRRREDERSSQSAREAVPVWPLPFSSNEMGGCSGRER